MKRAVCVEINPGVQPTLRAKRPHPHFDVIRLFQAGSGEQGRWKGHAIFVIDAVVTVALGIGCRPSVRFSIKVVGRSQVRPMDDVTGAALRGRTGSDLFTGPARPVVNNSACEAPGPATEVVAANRFVSL